MGYFDTIFKQPNAVTRPSFRPFKTFTEFAPAFLSYNGEMYQKELVRACIDRFATHCSKLKPEISGTAKPRIRRAVETSPNERMTWPQFLYRLATITQNDGTGYVVPVYASDMETVIGLFPLKCTYSEVQEYHGVPWIRFYMANGDYDAIELENVGIVTRHQYVSDVYGTRNCLDQTLALIEAQARAQQTAIANGATIRFIGSLAGQVREEEMKKKRDRFVADNLGPDNTSGVMLYDQTWQDIKQIEPQSFTIDPDEMESIRQMVYTYFGISEDILQNKFNENTWGAYYEGAVEPFAVQLGEVLTHMLFTQRERKENRIGFSSSRLGYASNASKRNMIRDMLDRGIISINEARTILQLEPLPNGDARVIRGEYMNANSSLAGSGDDDHVPNDYDKKEYDSDAHGEIDNADAEKSETRI